MYRGSVFPSYELVRGQLGVGVSYETNSSLFSSFYRASSGILLLVYLTFAA